jgi:sarcosine oxidase
MSAERFDAIVIGAGAAGSAAGYQLAKDGRRVLLLEQFEIGHARGSSHGESRIFRFAYPQAWYAKFAMQSAPLWRELERDCGERLLHTTGGLDFADDPDCFAEVRQIWDALRANGAACEELTGKEIRTRFPQWRNLPDEAVGTFSPDAGWLSATRCVRAMCAEIVKRGGVVKGGEVVTGLTGSVEVTTTKGKYTADRLVIAAGAWINSLLKFLGLELPLKVTKEQPVYFAPLRNAAEFRSPRFPIWIHYCKPAFTYGFRSEYNGPGAAGGSDGAIARVFAEVSAGCGGRDRRGNGLPIHHDAGSRFCDRPGAGVAECGGGFAVQRTWV